MKKLFILLIIAMFGVTTLNAQNLTFEGVAGLNMSNCGALGTKTGFHVGARGEYALPSIAEGVYANAGLLLSLKGFKMDWGILTTNTNAFFAEIPIHMGYKFAVNENFAVFGEAGPYVGVGLFGKAKGESEYFEDDEDSETAATFDSLKRFDLGVGLRLGVELTKRYAVSVGYDWGLINSNTGRDSYDGYFNLTPNMKHTNLTISFSYKF